MASKGKIVRQTHHKVKYAVRLHNRCKLCGRPKSYMRMFGLCRLCFRQLAHKGELPEKDEDIEKLVEHEMALKTKK